MRERIFSMETEYAVSFVPDPGSDDVQKEALIEALRQSLVEEIGIENAQFLQNGSRFYHDVGHAEWSLPECRSAREVAVYDKASEMLLAALLPRAEAKLAENGYRGQMLVIKNNVDMYGHTYGCHENYMVQRETPWLDAEDQLRLTIRYLVPHLTTRMILCGPGRVGLGMRLQDGFGFQISQRADFINAVVSRDTRDVRGIFNLGRENEPFAEGGYRRMHLISGDAAMSGRGTLLKLGTVGILLRMLEDLHIGEVPYLANPVEALHLVSRDPACRVPLELADGRTITAIGLQRLYLEQAYAYFELFPPSAEENLILQLWQETLDGLESDDPTRLFGKVDWVTKKYLMDRYLEQVKRTWSDPLAGTPEGFRLQEMDVQYHNVRDGLYYRLLKGKRDGLLDLAEIAHAQHNPPPYTRAYLRGALIASSRRTGARVELKSWNDARIGTSRVNMVDPLNFFAPELHLLLSNGKVG